MSIDRSVLESPDRVAGMDFFNDSKDTSNWLKSIGTADALNIANRIDSVAKIYFAAIAKGKEVYSATLANEKAKIDDKRTIVKFKATDAGGHGDWEYIRVPYGENIKEFMSDICNEIGWVDPMRFEWHILPEWQEVPKDAQWYKEGY